MAQSLNLKLQCGMEPIFLSLIIRLIISKLQGSSTESRAWFFGDNKIFSVRRYSMNKKLALSLVFIVASLLIFSMPTWAMDVDIKPVSCPNPLNVKSNGVIPVAILGTAELDVSQIDPSSVELAGVTPLRWSIEDVATPFNGAFQVDSLDCTEEGPDGIDDLTLKFDTQAVVEAIRGRDADDRTEVPVDLTGMIDGTSFEGSDFVLILNKGKGRR
jgi:hypothetical protein